MLPGTASTGRARQGIVKVDGLSSPAMRHSSQVSSRPHHGLIPTLDTDQDLSVAKLSSGTWGAEKRWLASGGLVTVSMFLKDFYRGREQAWPGSLDQCRGGGGGWLGVGVTLEK